MSLTAKMTFTFFSSCESQGANTRKRGRLSHMLRLIYRKVFSWARTLGAWIVFHLSLEDWDPRLLSSCFLWGLCYFQCTERERKRKKMKSSLIYDCIRLLLLLISSCAAVLTVGILSPLTCVSITMLHLMLICLIDPVNDSHWLI